MAEGHIDCPCTWQAELSYRVSVKKRTWLQVLTTLRFTTRGWSIRGNTLSVLAGVRWSWCRDSAAKWGILSSALTALRFTVWGSIGRNTLTVLARVWWSWWGESVAKRVKSSSALTALRFTACRRSTIRRNTFVIPALGPRR